MPTTNGVKRAEAPAILVVEDNFQTAMEVCDIVRDSGFAVAGSVARVKNGLQFLSEHPVDGALVDINLNGTYSFSLCAELERRKVPYWFLTGYQPSVIPPAFRRVPRLAKPASATAIRAALESMLPPPREMPALLAVDPPGNIVLQGLELEDWRSLERCLEQTTLYAGEVVERPTQLASHLIFPESGLLSMEAGWGPDGLQLAMIGREGMAGVSLLLGQAAADATVVVQYEGLAWRATASAIGPLLAQNHRLRERLLHGVGGLLTQLSSNAVAAACGTVEQRVARWLGMVSDRLQSHDITMSHEDVARSLGVRRASVTLALQVLEGKGLLRSRRRRVRILGRAQLAALGNIPSRNAAKGAPDPADLRSRIE
jgi:CRP-like cAMP-binding protein/CheY-like chemotaxis protein